MKSPSDTFSKQLRDSAMITRQRVLYGEDEYELDDNATVISKLDESHRAVVTAGLNLSEISKLISSIEVTYVNDNGKGVHASIAVLQDLMDVKVMGIGKQVGDLYYFDRIQGFNGFASKNERASTSENDSVMFEGDVADIHDIEHIENVINQHVRRYVGNANFNSKNYCFTTELNKDFEQKTYWQACKEHHCIKAINKEMTALYDNDTWDITDLLNDIIVTGSNIHEIEKFKEFLKTRFMIKDLGKLIYFLVIEVVDTYNGICMSQRKYCLDLLFEFGLLACKPSAIPL
ncbi:ribonuclease H-like domain-containing protein [Tanacetum coccineum]|uniref:Ribonuclease H-like domain-containing protein n=1 Tax=Tanacetum coccineum TaxID=301880 RepID=A0ABQ4XEC3_9ASTR